MSALTPRGSTRAWRRIRRYVLIRDAGRCRMTRNGRPCGRRATTVQHIKSRTDGGTDDPSNLIAACAPCNYAEGAAITNSNRRARRLGLTRDY